MRVFRHDAHSRPTRAFPSPAWHISGVPHGCASLSPSISIYLSFFFSLSSPDLQQPDAILIGILIRALPRAPGNRRARPPAPPLPSPPRLLLLLLRAASRLFVSFNRILVSRYASRCISYSLRYRRAPHPRNLYFRYYWKSSFSLSPPPSLSLSPFGFDENLFPSEARALFLSLSLIHIHSPRVESLAPAKLLYREPCVIVALISGLIRGAF